MDFANVAASIAAAQGLLTIAVLAKHLQTTPRNIDYWRAHHGLPDPFYVPPDRTRYWRHESVLEWVHHRERLALEGLTIEQVCERTGLSARRWRERIKAGKAPQPAGRELGSGRNLWWGSDIDAWLQQVSGGHRFPRRAAR